jgi:hypothetical protein
MPRLQRFVMKELGSPTARACAEGPIGVTDTNQLIAIDRPDLKFQPYQLLPERIREHNGTASPPSARRTSSSITLRVVRRAAIPEAATADPDVV